MNIDIAILSIASLTFFIGGLAKGAIGFGLPMIAIPMLTAFGSLPLALSIAVPPAIATNIWQFWRFREHRNISFLRPFLLASAVGLIAGTLALKNIENAYLEIALGVLVLAHLLRRSDAKVAMTQERQTKLTPAVGGLAGLVHGSIGLSGLVAPPFFLAAGLSRPAFIFATSAMFIVMAVLHLPTLALAGLYDTSAFLIGSIVILPAFMGVWIGGFLGNRLKDSTFPLLVKGMLMIAAILPIWGGFSFIFASTH